MLCRNCKFSLRLHLKLRCLHSFSTKQKNSYQTFATISSGSSSSSSGKTDHKQNAFTPNRRQWSPNTKFIIDRIVRVNHAGELGADRIYAGQMAVLGKSHVGPVIQHMWDDEKKHREKCEELINVHRARPSALIPLWDIAGYAIGAGFSLIGYEAAMASTVAVEAVITEHYNSQLRLLVTLPEYETDPSIRQLAETISRLRDDELAHHDTGLEHNAEKAPAYPILNAAVTVACRAAVWVAERV